MVGQFALVPSVLRTLEQVEAEIEVASQQIKSLD
jgi:hypothetical protein